MITAQPGERVIRERLHADRQAIDSSPLPVSQAEIQQIVWIGLNGDFASRRQAERLVRSFDDPGEISRWKSVGQSMSLMLAKPLRA